MCDIRVAIRPWNLENLEMSWNLNDPEKVIIFFQEVREKFKTVQFDLLHIRK